MKEAYILIAGILVYACCLRLAFFLFVVVMSAVIMLKCQLGEPEALQFMDNMVAGFTKENIIECWDTQSCEPLIRWLF